MLTLAVEHHIQKNKCTLYFMIVLTAEVSFVFAVLLLHIVVATVV